MRVISDETEANYSVAVVGVPRGDELAMPVNHRFTRTQLESGNAWWPLEPAYRYSIGLNVDRALTLAVEMTAGDLALVGGSCSSDGSGVAGFWTITTWKET